MIFTLRITGKNFDVKAFQRKTKWKVDRLWQKGTKDKFTKRLYLESGLNHCVFECEGKVLKRVNERLLKFFSKYESELVKTRKSAERVLDIGYIVGDEERQFVTGFLFDKKLLTKLVKTDTKLEISIYEGGRGV